MIHEWDIFKNDVFVLGLTILCLCSINEHNNEWNLDE